MDGFCLFHVSLLSKQNDKEAKDPGAQAREEEGRKHMDWKKRHGPCFYWGQAMLQLLNEPGHAGHVASREPHLTNRIIGSNFFRWESLFEAYGLSWAPQEDMLRF